MIAYMRRVDAALLRIAGVTHEDLPDWSWHDAFDDGMAPEEAALMALEEEGF